MLSASDGGATALMDTLQTVLFTANDIEFRVRSLASATPGAESIEKGPLENAALFAEALVLSPALLCCVRVALL